ncbi:Eco57I restriction-modification methylase domain-containing protein [Thermomonospora echinospora]|uniref:Eco57I restriction-modification methylase domain-containing protein n=1 Tax=Thermomonospora echinospora TaxID=1992 RepID=UPI00190E8500|nr:DNA methyltransferase [Thermomonospora echinospora]
MAPTVAEQHAEWLGLLRPDGPFLALSVLTEALEQGLDVVPDEVRDEIRQAWGEVQPEPSLMLAGWYDRVLRTLLRMPFSHLVQGATVEALYGRARPDLVAYGPSPEGRAMRLFIFKHGWEEPLNEGQPSPLERAAALCRETGVPLALVTNGRLWILVHARPGEATSTATFDADLWLEEPVLLRAFATLLGAHRSLAPARRPDGTWSDGLTALLARSAEAHTRVTDTLGRQVRQAVELLVGELARLDRESGGALLREVEERDVYRGALIVLMRLVFLLYAEEQELLPAGELYRDSYGVAALYDQLTAERDGHGEEVGDRRSAAWFRLLALFRAVHGGSEHDDLRIPAYGGSLFRPDTFGWLADAAVTDRVVHQILDALLILRHKKGKAAAERLSYKGLDVEQIGHVYEGLLEFSCLKVKEPYVGLMGKHEPELPLRTLEEEYAKGREPFLAWLKERTGATAGQLGKALDTAPDVRRLAALHAACDNDEDLARRIAPFFGLLRSDLRGEPTVYPAGSVLFTQVGDRRATGTHYTPKSLAQEIVQHTLAPLCHRPGSAEGAEEPDWQVKPAAELLRLKVCDPAMGSGAFLVSAIRYLAERLVEAWERDGLPEDVRELLGPGNDREDLLLMAKRRVAASCIYGVDRDDMAVELAKLSLWIETLAKDKPFSFLDHALRCGDSLVGLIDEAQVWSFHLDPQRGTFRGAVFENVMDELHPMLTRAQELREEIEAFPADDIERVTDKERKLAEAERLTERLRLAADAVAAAALSTAGRPAEVLDERLLELADKVKAALTAERIKELTRDDRRSPLEEELRATLHTWLKGPRKEPIKPFHWALEFPEVMRRDGFDAVVGNPPFIGGTMIKGRAGEDVLVYLGQVVAGGNTAGGRADLCSYFLLRNILIAPQGYVSIIATNTISQGDSREVGLDQAVGRGWMIRRAEKSRPWPGTASLEVSLVWLGGRRDREKKVLDGRDVAGITSTLDPETRVSGTAHRLSVNAALSFEGCKPLGMGFILTPEQASEILEKGDSYNEVIFPYLNGEDLNSRPDCSASRWIIDFNDMSIEEARRYPAAFSIVEQKVRPERQRLRPDGSYVLRRPLPQRWWQYGDYRPALRRAIAGFDRVLVITQTSRTQMPAFVPTGQVYSNKVIVFPTDRAADLCIRASNIQYWWTVRNSSTMRADLVYTPSDCCDTLPLPPYTERMDSAGAWLHSHRKAVMGHHGLGLTAVYNQVHDASCDGVDISRMRNIHVELDKAIQEAYGLAEENDPKIREFEIGIASSSLPSWREIDLDHGFYETRQGVRFTISPQARDDVLDKLLALNQYRYRQELEQGLHGDRGRSRKGDRATKGRPNEPDAAASVRVDAAGFMDSTFDDGLFAPPDALF